MKQETESWYVINEITGEEFGPFASFDEAHDSVKFDETFRVVEAMRREAE